MALFEIQFRTSTPATRQQIPEGSYELFTRGFDVGVELDVFLADNIAPRETNRTVVTDNAGDSRIIAATDPNIIANLESIGNAVWADIDSLWEVTSDTLKVRIEVVPSLLRMSR